MASPKGEPYARPKRFYKQASAIEQDGAWILTLDARKLRTPAGALLALPNRALADLVVEDWARQGERLDLVGMTATRLANAAIDRTPGLRREMADEVARFAETDLVCYVADHPAELRALQDAAWAPLRAWCAETHGVHLKTVEGLMPAPQPPASIEAVRQHLLSLSDLEATGLAHAVGLLGSAVLGLALQAGRITAPEAHAASRIDEDYQANLWGEDAEASARAALRLAETEVLQRWFDALGSRDRRPG